MKKNILPLILIMFVLFFGCTGGGTEIIQPDDASATLIGSVWAGETPREGDWLTITFKSDKKVIFSFAFDNTTNEWEYSFNSKNKGTITAPQGIWSPAPNGFTVSGGTLTITNYGSHTGSSRDFKRVRLANLTVPDVPFTLNPSASDLSGTVWAGNTPREGDWLTIAFKADNKVIMSFAIDNTTNEWEYSFTSGIGTITNPQGGWNPAPNGFTVNGEILTITNYGNHEGASRDFKRYR